jgi:RNA polymerase sigma-70 factor (ECF subfamily)
MTTPTTPRAPFAPLAEPRGGATDAEADLVRRAVDGDVAAIAALLRIIQRPVSSVTRRILGAHRADADDATQQALIAFIRALPGYRGEASPAAFAKTIAVRTALAMRRQAQSRAHRVDAEEDAGGLACPGPMPNEDALAETRRAHLRRLLDEIPAEQAEAIAMRIVLGWSLDEIASHAGVPINTVRSRIRLAKEALRRRIEATPAMRDLLVIGED